jgi:pimeloyl-ACP methyl ester carboxylesterase
MTSNIGALAGMDAGSDRAAIEAMRAAGISSDNLVTLVGHSQGGLLAARIAQSQEFRVGDVVTVGAPIHQVPIPREVTLTAIEHTEDLVPTLGGIALAGVGVGTGAAAAASLGGAGHSGSTTTVRRSALAGITPSPGDALPGHNLTRYVETGRVMDVSSDTQLTSLRSRLAANATGTAETTFWRAERLTR